MDPISIFGLVGTSLSIAKVVTQAISKLSELKSKYRNVPLELSTLLGQLYIVRAALDQISSWSAEDLSSDPRYQELAEQIDTSLDCFCPLISTLQQHLEELDLRQDLDISARGKILFLWNEQDLMGYLRHLDYQVNALNLFLQAVQCKTLAEQREFINDEDSRTILQKAKDCNTSVIGVSDGASIFSERTNVHTISLDFDFDTVLLGTRAYKSAHRSNLKQAVTAARRPQPSSSSDIQGPIAETSLRGPSRPLLPPVEMVDEPAASEPNRLNGPERHVGHSASPKSETGNSRNPDDSSGRPEDVSSSRSALQHGEPTSTEPSISHEQAVTRRSPLGSERIVDPSKFAKHRPTAASKTVVAPTSTLLHSLKQSWRTRATKPPAFVPLVQEKTKAPEPLEIKLLLLGSSESGKSTLLKGMKLSAGAAYSQADADAFSELVWANTLRNTRTVLVAMEDLGIPLQYETNEDHAQAIRAEWSPMLHRESPPMHMVDATKKLQLATSIHALWTHDTGFREAYRRRGEHQAGENLAYFASHIQRLGTPGYVASAEDILRLRLKTVGVTETNFIDDLAGHKVRFQVFDAGGTRSARKQWIHFFEKVDCIAFTVDASAYCRVLLEDDKVNRMEEQFVLWEVIANSHWFRATSFCLIFTKIDCLPEQWDDFPAAKFMRDFQGPASGATAEHIDAYLTYLEARFMSLVRPDETCNRRIKVMRADLVHVDELNPAVAIFEYAANAKLGLTG